MAFEAIEAMVHSEELIPPPTELNIQEVDLAAYDVLLGVGEVATC